MKCKDTYSGEEFDPTERPVQVCKSFAGYYIGQLEPCGAPYCRLSDYYKTSEEAEEALATNWPDRGADENKEIVEGLIKKGKLK